MLSSRASACLAACIAWVACVAAAAAFAGDPEAFNSPLLEARRGFRTKLTRQQREEEPLGAPPGRIFTLARYRGPAGNLSAYVGVPLDRTRKHPAIIWLTGGFPPGGAGSSAWQAPDLDDDQTAQQYRHAGIIMMYMADHDGWTVESRGMP